MKRQSWKGRGREQEARVEIGGERSALLEVRWGS